VDGQGDDDNGFFTIIGDELRTNASFDYEARSSYSIRVRTAGPDGAAEKVFTISVNDVNEKPTDIDLLGNSVAENLAAGAMVGTFATSDPDSGDSVTYALVAGLGGQDNGSFTIDASGNLLTAASFDYETKSSYSVLVRGTDTGGLFVEEVFTIDVSDVNESVAEVVDGSLRVVGTDAADSIMVSGSAAALTVTMNGVLVNNPAGGVTFTIAATGRVVFYGGAGDDVLLALLSVPVEAHGGAGNDAILTGFGHDVIWGDLGDDTIFAQFGDDVLIGGAGRDVLYGQYGNDLLFGGELYGTHDGVGPYDFATLRGISAAWAIGIADDDLASSLADDLDDTEQDVLFGGGERDWLLGNLTGANADAALDFLLNHDKKTSL
jgi:Ca2+-binding RTX toxin-like protein